MTFTAGQKLRANDLNDALFDSGWVDVAVASGYAVLGPTEKPQVRLKGGVIYMQGGWSNTGMSASATHTVGTIPEGYRPTQNVIVGVGSSVGAAVATGLISSSGLVQVRTSATLGSYYKFGGFCWPED